MTQHENQSATSQPTTVTAQGVLGLPEGSHVVLNRTMPEVTFQIIASVAPDVAGAMQTIDGQTAVLVTANDNLVEMRFDNAINLPANGDRPAVVCSNAVARLRILENGLFEFSTSATTPDPQAPPLSYQITGLSADLEMDAFVFSSNGDPQLRVTPSAGSGRAANIGAFTAPYLTQMPAMLRVFAPRTTGLVSVTQVS